MIAVILFMADGMRRLVLGLFDLVGDELEISRTLWSAASLLSIYLHVFFWAALFNSELSSCCPRLVLAFPKGPWPSLGCIQRSANA